MFSAALKGVVRREEVRQTEKDRVELPKCFRPSDIILARIISLGDQNNYLLSTAGDELGTHFIHYKKRYLGYFFVFYWQFCVLFPER